MIVLDEEHEASYKNGETPRYHARDVAAVRARHRGREPGARAAPRPRSKPWRVAERKLRLLRLPERIGARPMPPVELVDLRVAPKVAGTGAVAWSEALDAAVVGTLRAGRAGSPAAQPARLRGLPAVSRLRRGVAVPAVQHLAHGAHLAAGTSLPLLWPRRGRSLHLPRVRQPGAADARLRHPAARALSGRALSRGTARPDGSRYYEHQVVAPAHPRVGRGGRGGPAPGHADDRQGSRFPQRDAGGRGGRRHRALSARLPLGGAHVPAPGAGGGAGGPRAARAAGYWSRRDTPRITPSSAPPRTTPKASCTRSARCASRPRTRPRLRW